MAPVACTGTKLSSTARVTATVYADLATGLPPSPCWHRRCRSPRLPIRLCLHAQQRHPQENCVSTNDALFETSTRFALTFVTLRSDSEREFMSCLNLLRMPFPRAAETQESKPVANAEEQTISFSKLFSFADKYVLLLVTDGSLEAVIHDYAMPVFFLLFGDLVNGPSCRPERIQWNVGCHRVSLMSRAGRAHRHQLKFDQRRR